MTPAQTALDFDKPHLPHGHELGIPEHSPCHALWFAVRYLRAYLEPVYIGRLATMMNYKLEEWGKPEHHFMESSVQRFFRLDHVNSLVDYLPATWVVHCGKHGVKRGYIKLDIPGYGE